MDIIIKGGDAVVNKVLRILISLIGLTLGYQLMAVIFFVNQSFGIINVDYIPALTAHIIGSLIVGIIFYFLSSGIIEGSIKARDWIEVKLTKTPMRDILYGLFGLLMGLLVANLFARAFSGIPWIGDFLPILSFILMGYLGVSIAMKKKEELSTLISFPVLQSAKRGKVSENHDTVKPKILDTSVIIDGRIADICKSGFVDGILIIPGFVLEELRHIADSSDALKRNRGRRGLDMLNRLQKELMVPVEIYDGDFEDIAEVDSKLVKLAQVIGGKIITNDYNLNKVAEFQNVEVLNINELANAVKPVVLPGEEMVVQVIKDGKETGQGVAYLDDGTMIVVDGGKRHIGETIGVMVTSVLQTAAGRMIFAKPKAL